MLVVWLTDQEMHMHPLLLESLINVIVLHVLENMVDAGVHADC